jgi:hypothetical protein
MEEVAAVDAPDPAQNREAQTPASSSRCRWRCEPCLQSDDVDGTFGNKVPESTKNNYKNFKNSCKNIVYNLLCKTPFLQSNNSKIHK